MIRREITASNGQPAWVLISQVNHAHLSARVAEAWGNPPFSPLSPRAEILAGVAHHDDGWATWELHPEVDRDSGRPLDFTEMPIEVWLPIWEGSIEASARLGPLPGVMVAGHFIVLLRRFSSRWNHVPEKVALAEAFLARYESATIGWLAEWQSTHGVTVEEAAETSARALSELQWFDLLSLWFCCAERTEAACFVTPSGELTLTPQPGGQVIIDPWPLTVPKLDLTVPGRQVAATHYRSADELAAAPAAEVQLNWHLSPRSGN